MAGDLHRYARNFAIAAAAYGDPRDLSRYDRKVRRYCVRRALLQPLRASSRDDVDAIDPSSFDPMPPGIAQVLDRAATLTDEPARMRELAKAAIEEHGRHPQLLLVLAEAERLYGDRHAGAAMAAEAMGAAPKDPLIVAKPSGSYGSRTTTQTRCARSRTSPNSSTASRPFAGPRATSTGTGGCVRHAVTAFGRSGLEAWRWRMRRACWWLTGGPVGRIRSSIVAREDTLLSDLALPAPQAVALSALPLPAPDRRCGPWRPGHSSHDPHVPDGFSARDTRATGWTGAAVRSAPSLCSPRSRSPSICAGRWPASRGTSLPPPSLPLPRRRQCGYSAKSPRAGPLGSASPPPAASAGCSCCAAPGSGHSAQDLALIAFALVIVAAYILTQIVGFAWRIRIARWQREEAETGVLAALLDLLGELMVPQQRLDASVRRTWMADLERVAVIVERDLPYALRSGDPDSQSAIAARAGSAATALREMKQAVALPGGTAWQDLIKQLTGLAAALARHDFVSWPSPPQPGVAPARPSRPLWRQVMDVGRNLLLIFGPALVAYLLPLVIPLSGPGLSWLRFASIVWALLGSLIALDPAWTERMAKMRQGLDLLRNATPPKGTENTTSLYGTADTFPPQSPDTPRRTPPRPPRQRTTRTRR